MDTARIRCNKCEAESYYDGKTKIYCPTCFAQLEAELKNMTDIANKEHASSAHIAMRNGELEDENKILFEIIKCGATMGATADYYLQKWLDNLEVGGE